MLQKNLHMDLSISMCVLGGVYGLSGRKRRREERERGGGRGGISV